MHRFGVRPGTGIPAFVSLMKYFCTRLATCRGDGNGFAEGIKSERSSPALNMRHLLQSSSRQMWRNSFGHVRDVTESHVLPFRYGVDVYQECWSGTCLAVLFPSSSAIFCHRLDSTSSGGNLRSSCSSFFYSEQGRRTEWLNYFFLLCTKYFPFVGRIKRRHEWIV